MILVIMGVGYAAFSSQLKISGTSNIASNFLVKITDIQSTVQSGSASDAVAPTHTDTTATFKTNLVSPGDSMKYDITVANQGNIDAVLESINVNTGENETITFETSGIENGDKLEASQTDILTVIVSYNNSVTSQPENTNSTITVTLNYKQDDGTVILPSKITIGGQEVELVESGDGLYADSYESGRYIYRGQNPNNYITFNGEIWRIIAKETDETYKIIKNSYLDKQVWDKTETEIIGTGWDFSKPTTLNTYLNNTYYNSLDESIKNNISNHIWPIGPVIFDNSDLEEQIDSEKSIIWTGNVGLISVSDYIRANSNMAECGNHELSHDNNQICMTTNWLHMDESYWTISVEDKFDITVPFTIFYISSSSGYPNTFYYNDSRYVVPSVFLKSDITFNGKGTLSEPYKIVS